MTPQPTILTKDAILGATDRPTDFLDIPEWGGSIRVRGLDAGTALAMEKLSKAEQFSLILQRGIVNETGAPLFAEGEIPALMERSLPCVVAVAEKVIELSKLAGHSAGK